MLITYQVLFYLPCPVPSNFLSIWGTFAKSTDTFKSWEKVTEILALKEYIF